jgi:hypothetical protein
LIYLILDNETDEELLDEIVEWGLWEMRIVRSVEQALAEHRSDPCDLMILLGASRSDARQIADAFPYLPVSIAALGGWEEFHEGFPPQVVFAQWAAPRPGEFMSAVETALSVDSLSQIHDDTADLVHDSTVDIGLVSSVSEELLQHLAAFPEERSGRRWGVLGRVKYA